MRRRINKIGENHIVDETSDKEKRAASTLENTRLELSLKQSTYDLRRLSHVLRLSTSG